MARGSWITRARRQRAAIGLIAAYAWLLSALLPATVFLLIAFAMISVLERR